MACSLPVCVCSQWLPESARYDVLTGNQEKALATLKRIATENGVPMPLGKLIAARQVQHSLGWQNMHALRNNNSSPLFNPVMQAFIYFFVSVRSH